jgi:hypothetical protein
MIKQVVDKPINLAGLHSNGIRAQVTGRSAASDTPDGVRLDLLAGTRFDGYANAQLDDYRVDRCTSFRWSANVEMTVRARFTASADELAGTAGFGFWNAPIGLGVRRLPSPPAAVWFFFAGPNSNIAAARGVPGHGWKAASIDTRNPLFLALLPAAPIALPMLRLPGLYAQLWPVAQRAMRVDERMLNSPLDEWHDYSLIWTKELVRYVIDGQVVHTCHEPPRARMGFVLWLDNQWMVATPQGRFGQGTVPVARPRSMEVAQLQLLQISP